MNIRNFWTQIDIDGRATSVQTGPRARDGGMTATFKIRDNGSVSDAVIVNCLAIDDVTLEIQVIDVQTQEVVYSRMTDR